MEKRESVRDLNELSNLILFVLFLIELGITRTNFGINE
jgi:hypothetical protein